MAKLALSLLLLLPLLAFAQVGANCVPIISQNVQSIISNGTGTFYHVVLNITNTGFNQHFEESTAYSTANLPLNIAILSIGYSEHITIVSTFGLAPYESSSTTYSLLLGNQEILPFTSFLGAGYVSLNAIPTSQMDVWGCDYSYASTSPPSNGCSSSVTMTPSSSWEDPSSFYQLFTLNVFNAGSSPATFATVQFSFSHGEVSQYWNMEPLDGNGPNSSWKLSLFGLQPGQTYTGNGFIYSIPLAQYAQQGDSLPYNVVDLSTICS